MVWLFLVSFDACVRVPFCVDPLPGFPCCFTMLFNVLFDLKLLLLFCCLLLLLSMSALVAVVFGCLGRAVSICHTDDAVVDALAPCFFF